jgi:hypothetical protein
MITKFKIFENLEYKTYYFIPYKEKEFVFMAINKIDMSDISKKFILNNKEFLDTLDFTIAKRNMTGCFIISHENDTAKFWICDDRRYTISEAIEYFKNNDIIDGGTVKLKDWEIAANKYNL